MNNDKFAIVTGGSRGVGFGIAKVLAEKGYNIGLISINSDRLSKAGIELANMYPNVDVDIYSADVSDAERIGEAISFFAKKHGNVDVLVNNAGLFERGAIESFDLSDYQSLVMTNQFGSFNVLKCIVPMMKQQKSGYIFNIASMSGLRALADHGAYASTKFALIGLSQSLRKEMLPYGVKVTAICPGVVATDMTANIAISEEDKIQPEDIGKLISCCLDMSHSVTIDYIPVECSSQV
ncbi:SDR family NAD(P)-dependent oxidoreductase [Vibrio sp. OCN044]|uniref:SDR family NAD(P)-dependent oxidoreductase n=1 Tax=Vibrio tetraodonis subsp. pristinus TaxID=2695891 RepID=A0A6L8LSI3_9VIBR|nr:SDR family oxidoreductase [Vibrio tetraodonis]MYM59074.1 SDR family NAD(P)-dependent oxidoreductase [Vibrio tetraodonis subsp. pristinus]